MFANNKGLGALANELLIRILGELDATDLVSCSKVRNNLVHLASMLLTIERCQVNRAFKTLVDEAPSLRNKLVFHAAGMREGPPGGSSISERLAQLAEYESTWKTGTIPTGQRPSPDYSDAGGLFVNLDYDQSQLVIRRPASFFSGVPEKAWIVDLSQLPEQGGPELELLPSCSYAVDIAQDLLVLMVLPQDDEE